MLHDLKNPITVDVRYLAAGDMISAVVAARFSIVVYSLPAEQYHSVAVSAHVVFTRTWVGSWQRVFLYASVYATKLNDATYLLQIRLNISPQNSCMLYLW